MQSANHDLTTLLLQFNAVSELMSSFSMPLEKDRVLASIAAGVSSELTFDRVAVWGYEPSSRSFVGRAGVGLPVELVRSVRFPLQACLPLVRQVINEGRILRQEPVLLAPMIEMIYESLGEPMKPALMAPLLSRGRERCWRIRPIPEGCAKAEAGPEGGAAVVIDDEHVHATCLVCSVFPVEGFLWADNARTGRSLGEDLLPLDMYLRHADLVIENASLYEELSKVTIQDALTGVYNSAYFDHLVRLETERSLRYGHPSAILFFDVHGMSTINRVAGQAIGDRLLSALGDLFRSRLRRIDFVARHGGDEFAILLPHTDGERALSVAQRLHISVSEHQFNLPGHPGPIMLSAGLAVVPENAADPDTVLSLAQLALQEAQKKRPGTTVRIGDPKTAEEQ